MSVTIQPRSGLGPGLTELLRRFEGKPSESLPWRFMGSYIYVGL